MAESTATKNPHQGEQRISEQRIMRGRIERRLLGLERKAEIERAALMAQARDEVFEAMRISDEDNRLLDAICEGGPSTQQEQAALDRFLAEYDAAFNKLTRGSRSARWIAADNDAP